MRKKLSVCLSGIVMLAVGISGCTTDEAYNQLTEENGIDLTINVAPNGLTLPLGSIDRIWLTEVMDTAVTDILKIDPTTNRFYIEESGSLDNTSINVEKVKFGFNPTLPSGEFRLDVEYSWNPIIQAAIDNMMPDTPLDGLFQDSHIVLATRDHMDIENTDIEALNLDLTYDKTDDAIVSISAIDFDYASGIQLTLNVSGLPGENQEYDFKIDSVRLLAPEFFNLVDKNGNKLEKDAETGKFILPATSVHKSANTKKVQWEMATVKLDGIDFGNNKLINNKGVISRDGEIRLGGKIMIDGLKVEASDLKVVGKREGSTHNTVELKSPITIDPVVKVDSIFVRSITGVFDPKIKDMSISTVLELDSKLDFLTDMRTNFDPEEVTVGIDLAYNCPLSATAWAEMANEYEERSRVEGIRIYDPEDSENLHITISTKDPEGKPDTYQFHNIGEVFSPVPEKLFLNVGIDVEQKETEILLGKEYKVYADYHLYFPLSFNKVNSTYEEVIEDVFKDLEDTFTSLNEVTLELTAVSTLGIDTKVTIMGRNQNGVEDPSIISCNQTGIIKHGTVANPVTSNLSIVLSIKDISAVKDLLVQLNISGENCVLQPDQYLEVTDMKLSFKNQSINLNDKE